MTPAQQLKDQLIQSRVHRERDQFIASITERQVRTLASSYRNATPCDFFDKPKRGSYNICYFVRFPDDLKWVVRVPLAPCLAFGGRSKLETEIATMQYVILGFPVLGVPVLGVRRSIDPNANYCFLRVELSYPKRLSQSLE